MAVHPKGMPVARSSPRRMVLCAVAFMLVAAVFGAHVFAGDSPARGGNIPVIRVGFSSNLLIDVNENDAKASLKAWAQVISGERNIPLDPDMSVLNGTEEISRALKQKTSNAFSITTDEYWALEGKIQSSQVLVGVYDGRITEEYVLLVHQGSGIGRVADLRGKNITIFHNPRMSLASAWLDTFLLKEGLGPASKFFARVTPTNKLSRVVLPVFFHQREGCVVTRRGFQLMSELNPQVGRQLKVIASSPELVPAGLFLQGDFSPSAREKVLAEFSNIDQTPTGQQALTLYQCDKLEVHPISILQSSLELLTTHARLCAAMNRVRSTQAEPSAGKAGAGVN